MAFELLAKSQGIKLKERDYPIVTSEESEVPEVPYYNLKKRIINIPVKSQDYAAAYFEEASHALRDLVQKKRLVYRLFHHLDSDLQVHEFYGRIGWTLGRDLSKGTEFETLFEKEKDMDLLDRDWRNSRAASLRLLKNSRNIVRELQKKDEAGRNYFKDAIEQNHDVLTDLFNDWNSKRVSLD